MSELERLEATEEERAAAFEWLRELAADVGAMPREQRLAAIALQEWHEAAALAEGRIRAMQLEPGDVLVYQTEEQLSDQQQELVMQILGREFAGVRILVIENGAELQAFRPPAVAGAAIAS